MICGKSIEICECLDVLGDHCEVATQLVAPRPNVTAGSTSVT
jgi:hypothetical protein